MNANRFLPFVLILLASGPAAAQIVTENAGTLSPETPLWQTRLEYLRTSRTTDLRVVESLTWAPNARMDLSLSVPLHHRDIDRAGIEETLEGLGDAVLRWKGLIHKADGVMKSTRVAALAGIQVPTGGWRERDEGVGIPRPLQLGTGSFGFSAGPLFTRIDDRHRFAAEAIGRFHLERDGYRPGPAVRVGAAYWYRIAPSRIDLAGAETEIRGVLEVTGEYAGRGESDGRSLRDGGRTVWVSPGVQVYPATWALFEAGVRIPVIDTVEDLAGDRKLSATLAVKFLF